MFGLRWLRGGSNDESEEQDEEETEEDDGLIEIDAHVNTEYSSMVTREKLEIIWADGSSSTQRWCDDWEKEDGDYVLKSSTETYVNNHPKALTNPIGHVYEVDLTVPADGVKAIDVIDSREWEATAETRVTKNLTMPVDEMDDYETKTTKKFSGHDIKTIIRPIMDRDQYVEYCEEYGK